MFDMESFLNDLRQSHKLTDMELLAATLHHCWEDHPITLKVEPALPLIALTPNLALDFSDISSIVLQEGTYIITHKSDAYHTEIHAYTPEFEAMNAVIATLNNER